MPTRETTVPAASARRDRATLGLTQGEVAERLDISMRAVQLYEKRGAPEWYRYALAGMKLEKAGLLNGDRLLGSDAETAERSARKGKGRG